MNTGFGWALLNPRETFQDEMATRIVGPLSWKGVSVERLAREFQKAPAEDRAAIARKVIFKGGDPSMVNAGHALSYSLKGFGETPQDQSLEALKAYWTSPVWTVIRTASMAASAFHGYRRNESIGWALWWGLMGSVFPIITPVIAVAQGFGETKR